MGYSFDRLPGRTKEMLGKATGNKRLEMKGRTEAGMADMKDKAKHTINKIEDRLDN